MRTISLPELMALFGGVIAVGFYVFLFFVVWKFYQMLEKINGNIAGIREALERNSQDGSKNA